MKKLFLIGLIATFSIICTGCVNFDYSIEINKKDQVSISQTQSVNVKLFSALAPSFDVGLKNSIENLSEKYIKQGYQTKEYDDGVYRGITVLKDNLTFTRLQENLPSGFDRKRSTFTADKNFIKSYYKIHLYYDINKALSCPDISVSQRKISMGKPPVILSNDIETTYINGQLVNMTEIKESYNSIRGEKPSVVPISNLTIKIPAKAKFNNADKVINEKEYQWNLVKENQQVEIILEYEVIDFSIFTISISLILLLGSLFYIVQKVQNNDFI